MKKLLPRVAIAVKLRAIALSEISQMLNETLPYLRLRVSPAGLPATPRLGVQRNFARLGRAQRLLLPAKLQFVRQAKPAELYAPEGL